ncbi:FAD binding domain-containing protein [Agrobacterium tumefaciens]|uniref:FAD binding domain-containing protein n=1 Tax=Agrobacterium tumefaciens TaxID=358 RepID=UPI0015739229|nr:FAD binding domain-containing protein [Agrobacterium tumefaciens]NTC82564.1 FAD-binding protein [Agrobacterium tumefaciens]NTD11387.1 FAD-binding protein [Agrobacterium tumefaciens]NTD88297.1 FAD-binding protein [Agrobacterium tumefaciens]NTD92606.1 FAD-binding protein [Agrobacterium tumefaciens]NTE00935.1 FAD-binding protein [Agrobacterium tumefaciens]
MKPAAFTYMRPDNVDEALQILAEYGSEARVLAGGQSLMAMLNLRLVEPGVLLDISRLPALRHIRLDNGFIEVGAAVTQAELLAWPDLEREAPFIAQALPWVGHFQTRNRGTVCGSISHADPSSELPLSLALLQGEAVLRSSKGERRLAARDYQTGMLQTARREDELLVAVRFPVGLGRAGASFQEVSRRHGDFAIVSAGVIRHAGRIRIGIGGVADRPSCIELDENVSAANLTDRIEQLAWELGGYDDIHASARFRRDLVRRLAPKLVSEVLSCA